jgi:hypothetical protein
MFNTHTKHDKLVLYVECLPGALSPGVKWGWCEGYHSPPSSARAALPRVKNPGTRWIGGWVGPRAVLDAVAKKKNSIIAPVGN